MNPYQDLVRQFSRAYREGRQNPLGQFPPSPRPNLPANAPKALIFSPHPDDEVIIGGLPLRLLHESRVNVLNVAVTQGSNPSRQAQRLQELQACCDYIGFGLVQTRANGLEGVNLQSRREHPDAWAKSVTRIEQILLEQKPRVIFLPHDDDWNSTHIGTHFLVMDALVRLGTDFECVVIETEFWGAMKSPNLMVESSERDVVDLITALTFHVGEVRRNPYHLRLPAWLMDNVRRGGELVGGQGGAAPDFTFATLYRFRRWHQGAPELVYPGGKFISASENPALLLG
jgi:N-acetylglucosamine malate deacetylase 1